MATISRETIRNARRWVIKIGSALLTANGKGISREILFPWVEQIVALRKAGHEVVVVSSGAVAEGMSRMGWSRRPKQLNELQAAAAIGQMGLVQAYESCFLKHGLHTAQILLTRDDLSDRSRYLNARSTMRTLLSLGVIPIVNENDTVTTDELRFGDNDTLAALVVNLIEAELLVLLTDQEGVFDADPRFNTEAVLIGETRVDNTMLDAVAGGSASGLGLGGMVTKIRAARLASRSGAGTVIASGRRESVLTSIGNGEKVGTLLVPSQEPQVARKRWLAGQLQVRGSLVLDDGAVRQLREKGSSLLAVGVVAVKGNFVRGEAVVCLDGAGCEVARGLVNYGSQEAMRIVGKPSNAIESILGYVDEQELIHRDNLVLL